MDDNAARWRSAVLKMRPILRSRPECNKLPYEPAQVSSPILIPDDGRNRDKDNLSWKRLHAARSKLKSAANTSEILSLFTLVTMVEVQINTPTEVPDWMWILFSVSTTVLVSVHVFALMIATYLLPVMEPNVKLHTLDEAPHEKMKIFIELAWILSNTIGLFLFIMQLVILCWVKFYDYSHAAAITAMSLAIPVLLLLCAFAIYFNQVSLTAKWSKSVSEVHQLERMQSQLDSVV